MNIIKRKRKEDFILKVMKNEFQVSELLTQDPKMKLIVQDYLESPFKQLFNVGVTKYLTGQWEEARKIF